MARLTLTLEGSVDVVNGGVDSFVRQNGWTEATRDAEGHPVAQAEYARLVLSRFFRDTCTAWNIKVAQAAAAAAAAAQTTSALDAVTLTLTVG